MIAYVKHYTPRNGVGRAQVHLFMLETHDCLPPAPCSTLAGNLLLLNVVSILDLAGPLLGVIKWLFVR